MTELSDLVAYELAGLQAGRLPLPSDLPPGIALRSASLPADLPAVEELVQQAFASPTSPGLANDEAEKQGEVQGLIRHPGLAPPGIFLAVHGKLAVGLAVGRIEVPAAGDVTRRAAVELLAVHPGYRRQGIARALLRRLLAWLADRGVQTVLASTGDPIVVALLEKHGFQASPLA